MLCTQGSFKLSKFPSCLRLTSSPSARPFHLSIHPAVNTLAVTVSWLQWLKPVDAGLLVLHGLYLVGSVFSDSSLSSLAYNYLWPYNPYLNGMISNRFTCISSFSLDSIILILSRNQFFISIIFLLSFLFLFAQTFTVSFLLQSW